MPTSVLLAVLAAAGLLALAPALVRRHDATERQVAERAQSTARVLPRRGRRRSVPGSKPVNPSRVLVATLRTAAPVSAPGPADDAARTSADAARTSASGSTRAAGSARAAGSSRTSSRAGSFRAAASFRAAGSSGAAGSSRAGAGGRRVRRLAAPRAAGRSRPARRRPQSPAIYRRRRVLASLLLLNVVKLVGVAVVGPGFWVGFAVTGTLLAVYVVHLRNLAVADQRRRRAETRRAEELAAQQALVRRQQERRAAARREGARRMAEQRESLRRAVVSGSVPPTVSYRRASGPSRRAS